MNDTRTLALSERLEDDQLLDGSNRARISEVVSQVADTKDNKERENPTQRKRHYLAKDSNNQPERATSSGARPSSWINDLFGWVKSSIGWLLVSKPEGSVSQVDEKFTGASVSNSSLTSTTLPSDGKIKNKKMEVSFETTLIM